MKEDRQTNQVPLKKRKKNQNALNVQVFFKRKL